MELCPLKSRVFLLILALQGIHPSNPSFRLANECVGLVHAKNSCYFDLVCCEYVFYIWTNCF